MITLGSTGGGGTPSLKSFVLQDALTAQHLAGSFQKRNWKAPRGIRSAGRQGEHWRQKPRVACWPDKAAACLYLSFPGQQKRRTSRIQIGSSNGARSIWRLRHSLHLEQICAAQLARWESVREGKKEGKNPLLLLLNSPLNWVGSPQLWYLCLHVNRLRRSYLCLLVSYYPPLQFHLVKQNRHTGRQHGNKVAVEPRMTKDNMKRHWSLWYNCAALVGRECTGIDVD